VFGVVLVVVADANDHWDGAQGRGAGVDSAEQVGVGGGPAVGVVDGEVVDRRMYRRIRW